MMAILTPDDEPIFPTVEWGNETATFFIYVEPDPAVPCPVALVFPFYGDRVVLGDIAHRGWCIPSGHVEPGETPEAAVRREAGEEAGVTLGRVAYLGSFILTHRETGQVRQAPTFIGEVVNFGAMPEGSESRGMMLASVEDVAGLYFSWDALLADVFNWAWAQKAVVFPVGVSLSSLTSGGD